MAMIMNTLFQNKLPGKMKFKLFLPNDNKLLAPTVSRSVTRLKTFSATFLSSWPPLVFWDSVVE